MRAKKAMFLAPAALCVVAVALMPTSSFAAGHRGSGRSAGKTEGKSAAAARNERYIVVRVGEPTGAGELQAIKQTELRNLQKTTRDEDRRLQKEYEDKVKEARKNKQSVSDLGKKPVTRRVAKVSPIFKTQELAAEWKDKHPEKAEVKKPGA